MPDDKLPAELAGIRRRAQQITQEHAPDDCDLNGETCTGHDAERLLAAVDAVLQRHKPFGGNLDPDACAGCDETVPCQTIQAISRALLGSEASDDGLA